MAKLDADGEAVRPMPPTAGSYVEDLFRARYLEMVRLAGLLGADDPGDIAQEAFTRLMNRHVQIGDPRAALGYLRAIVCNLTRNRHRHLRIVRLRTPTAVEVAAPEQAVMRGDDHQEVIAALAELPRRRREAIVLRYWLDLPEREIAAAMGVRRAPSSRTSAIAAGPQLCNATFSETGVGGGSTSCLPLPPLSVGQPASVTGSENVGTGQTIVQGAGSLNLSRGRVSNGAWQTCAALSRPRAPR